VARRKARLADLERDVTVIEHRMSRERDDELYEALSRQFVAAKAELKTVQEGVERLRKDRETVLAEQPEARVEAVLKLLNEIIRIADDPVAWADANPLLRRLGVLIGLSFAPAVKGKKRKIQRLVSGRIVFGDGALPVPCTARIMQTAALRKPPPTACHWRRRLAARENFPNRS
jgi:hypothetical protein